MRKAILISGILIVVAAAAFLGIKYFPFKKEKPVIQTFSTKQNPAFKAVPQKSPLVIEVKNQDGFFNLLKGNNPAFAELRGIPEFDGLFSSVSRFKDFVSSRSGISDLLKGKSIIISVNPSGKNQLSNLFLVQLNDKNESSAAPETVSRELGSAYTITRKNYDNTTVFGAKSAELNFFYACTDDIFMVSEDFILIEAAIRHSNSQNLLNNHGFTEVYKTIEETALANVFINHLTIHQVLSRFVAPEIRKNIGQIASYSNWSELDLSVDGSNIEFNGYSVTRDSSDNYLNVFRNQDAPKSIIEKAIPANASYFVSLNLNNASSFLDHYETYVKANGTFYPREMSLIGFEKKTKTNPVKLIKELGGKQYAAVYTTINKSNPTQNRFFITDLANASDAEVKLVRAVAEFDKTGVAKPHTEYVINSNNKFKIYQLPISSMAESLFGRIFSGVNGEYFVIYKKFLIWGDNLPGLKNYLQSLASEKTMANDSIYQAYAATGQANPNLSIYAKVPKVFRLKDAMLKPETSAMLSDNEDIIRKFSTFSWQFSISDNMIKNKVRLKYDPNVKEEPQAIWQLKLEAPLARKPKLVLNHKDLPNREVIVCDKQNNIYLINKDGVVLWNMNIPGEIVSDILQVDLYQNNRFQYVFNTKTQIYVIDRMGNKFGKFPITLKSMASNGVSIVDYGKNKEFRFFVAGEDKKIYAFDRWGKLVQNWNFAGSESPINRPGERFEIDDKDYLVFSDSQNTYFLDRQGKSRDIQPAPFDRSGNPAYFFNDGSPKLIATDKSGKIHIIDFTGQAELRESGKFGAGHRFAAADLDRNGSPEYLFAEGKKLTAFTTDGKKLFERSFPEVISEIPSINPMAAGNSKIGIVCSDNKIYLLDKNGSIMQGFPLEGNSSFILEKFNDASTWYNLIVGGEGNTLVNYRIE
jgi:outer membrane protein assembly factor BamB